MKARIKKPGVRAIDPEDEKKKKSGYRKGSAAIIRRNKKGRLEAELKDDFGGVTQETMREDAKVRATTGRGNYDGGPAPRVGGNIKIRKDGPVRGGTKSMVRKAKKRVRHSAASKGAKKAAIRAYKI